MRARISRDDGRPRAGSRVLSCWSPPAWTVAAALLLGVALAPVRAVAQSPYDGRPIASIDYQGLVLLSEETLNFYLGLETGQPFDSEKLDTQIQELWSKRLIDDLEVEAEPEGGGVHLTFTIVERPVLRSVDYVGLKRLSKTDIDDRLGRERIDLGEGLPLDRGAIQRTKAMIEEMYREKGYRFALVQVIYDQLERGEVRANFTIDEGDKVRIGDIDFEGNEVFSDLRLRWSMKKTKESGPLTRITKKDIYNPATLDEDLTAVRDLYRSAGYKNVLIGDPTLDVAARGEKRRLVLTVPIDEGERWRFGQVSVEGNEKFKTESLLSLFELRSGAWLRSDAIDEAVEKVEQVYNNSGYIFARVEPELVEVGPNVADLVVHVEENDQFRVGRIEFEGNTATRDKVLRRELRVQEGLFINLGAVKNSIFKINQLGYFKLDEADPVQFDPNTEEKTVNLKFRGGEDNRTELQFGAGYSDFQGFFGQVAFRTRNFLGRGETLGLSAEIGSQRNLFDISYFVPWFLDRPQSVGVQAFRSDLDFSLGGNRFERKSRGAVLSYGRNYSLFQSVSVSYNFSRFNDLTTTFDGAQLSSFDIKNSSIRPAWVFNSVDNRFEPTRGQRIRASVEYAGGPLGGNNYFIRPEVGYSIFVPVSNYPVRTVFGFNTELGWVEPFGEETVNGIRQDRVLFPLERYYLGGENSVRGHRNRSLMVRDEQTELPIIDPNFGSILGGDRRIQFNLEYHFLVGGPFRVVAFVDGGNVFGDYDELIFDDDGNPVLGDDGRQLRNRVSQNIDLGRLRWTAGVEFRLLVPVFGAPLRFIYAQRLDDELPDENFESFRFSIGAAF